MYKKKKLLVTLVAGLIMLSGCTNKDIIENTSQLDEKVSVNEESIDNIQVDTVINNAYNRIVELDNDSLINGIEFIGDNLYILSTKQDESVNIERYNLVTNERKSVEVAIENNSMLQLNIKNDYILISNVEVEWESGNLVVYDTELNYINTYEDIYTSYAYNKESVYYYDIENNSLITINDNKKEYLRNYNEQKIDGCIIASVQNMACLDNMLYMNVSYIQEGKGSSENGYVCIDLTKNIDTLYKENKNIISSNKAILLVDNVDSAFDFNYSTLLPDYKIITNDKVIEGAFETGAEALSPALSCETGIIITMEKINHKMYDVNNNELICTIPDENSDWYLYASVCEKYRFLMACSYEYENDELNLNIKTYEY